MLKKCNFLRFLNLQEKNFKNSFPKEFIATPIDMLSSKFVKYVRREIGKVVRYLPDKKEQNFASLSSYRYCTDRVKNLPEPAADNILRVLQISSKSVHFRRRYTQTREHHQNGPKLFPVFG